MNCTVVYNGVARSAEVGTLLSELTGVALPCGGVGRCGKCKVQAFGALSPLSEEEKTRLSAEEIKRGIRLACRTRVLGDCTVEASALPFAEVLTDGRNAFRSGSHDFKNIGVAVDIGTTTWGGRLYAADGTLLSSAGMPTPHAKYGADVLTRIENAIHGKSEEMQRRMAEALDALLSELCAKAHRRPSEIDGMVVTGNTAMLCFLTETSVEPLSHAPFSITEFFGKTLFAREIGLSSVRPETGIYLPPCISAFVGADTVCALLACRICDETEPALLADIGTNGEMALWQNGMLSVCSTAAGPAFEGVHISMGMTARSGAIDRVSVQNGELVAHTVGETPPEGICGSGLVDAVASLLDSGRMDETGTLSEDPLAIAFPVALTQKDIRMVQLAKSAICAGLETLLSDAHLAVLDVHRLFLAGGFGNFLDEKSAVRIGLLPPVSPEAICPVGNASLDGAALLLLDRSAREEADRLSKTASVVDLSKHPVFSERFQMGMLFEE